MTPRLIDIASDNGQEHSVTNGRFQEAGSSDRFPAMNLKSGRSLPDPYA